MLGREISFAQATREGFRRGRAAVARRRERAMLAELASQPARLLPEFAALSSADLLKHFRTRNAPRFLPGLEMMGGHGVSAAARDIFPDHTRQLIAAAERITTECVVT